LEVFFRELPEPLADVNPLVVLAWRESAHLEYIVESEVLYLFGDTDFGRVLWTPPLAKAEPSRCHIRRGLELLRENKGGSGAGIILNLWKDDPLWSQLACDPAFAIACNSTEYHYDTSAVAALAGQGLRKKRADARFFLNKYKPIVMPFEPKLVPECLALLDEWLIQKRGRCNMTALGKAEREYQVCKTALQDHLPLLGIVCAVGPRLVAFSLGVAHRSAEFNCIFEKTDLDLRGSSAFAFSALAKSLLGRFARINAGEDWGLPSLALAKRLWRPVLTRPTFRLAER